MTKKIRHTSEKGFSGRHSAPRHSNNPRGNNVTAANHTTPRKEQPRSEQPKKEQPRHCGGSIIEYPRRPVTDWLPTSVKEMKAHGWEEVDIVIFSGDAYVDHPSFGAAVLGRLLVEVGGDKVAIVPPPNWKDDLR
ncbi:MAG: hypothetical protein K2I61_02185, partial [Muribaculaceae bacterium]|nr:hypothetical protein [Muribaculaceae bacterium]